MMRGLCISAIVAAVLAMVLPACAPLQHGKDDFQVRAGKLFKGKDEFTIKAIQVPDVGASGGTLDAMIPTMARIAEAGGNTICFDLAGFSADGKELDAIGVKTVKAFSKRAKDQRMAVLLRVLGDNEDPDFRKQAVATAAKALSGQGIAVYWIDGPGAAELAETFKKKAKNLVTASAVNGDVLVTKTPPAEDPGKLVMVEGAIPDPELGDIHFVLDGDDGDYTALDAALTREEEKAPWTPDNSVLSEAERNDGFIALFDGKTLDGWWIKDDNKEAFHVSEEGYIEWLSGGGGALMSRDRYGDFILRLEWKILPDGNSGVWVRAPRYSRQSKIGFEIQMRGDSTTEEPDKDSTCAIYDVVPPASMAAKPEGQWNDLEAVLDGPHVKLTLNGVVVQDLNFDENEELRHRLRKGFICLTDHGNYVAFRNIRLKKLRE